MLKHLSGSWHEVMTGIALIDTKDFRSVTSVEITKVKMKNLRTIQFWHMWTQKNHGQGRAYGIQEKGPYWSSELRMLFQRGGIAAWKAFRFA